MAFNITDITDKLPGIEKKLHLIKETLLANLVMISEIPAPTFKEYNRMRFLVNKFTEYDLLNCSTDETGNGLGILQGKTGEKNILIVAHLDTVFDYQTDHTVSVQPNSVSGPGIGDNSLGVAVLASLPAILDHLNIKLDSNLILMGSARSLGRGDIEGLRFFLKNTDIPVSAGLCLEGVKLGRISYSSIGMVRCEISHEVSEEYDWTRFGAVSAIVTINEVINKILEIPLPKRPRSNIVIGSIQGGTSFDTIATKAKLRFEIRSESAEMVKKLHSKVLNITAEVSSNKGEDLHFTTISQRNPGGIDFSHPLSLNARKIMDSLNIKPRISPSLSELSAFIYKKIPALTLGLTNGENVNELGETIEIESIFKGITQLLGIILAIDKGCCDESE